MSSVFAFKIIRTLRESDSQVFAATTQKKKGRHAGCHVNQLLAGSQHWGCSVAKDDVTENTICQPLSHCLHLLFWAIFILETTTHTHTYRDSFSSRDLFSNIHQCDAHITHAWIHLHTQTQMHTFVSRISITLWRHYWWHTGAKCAMISQSSIFTLRIT